MVDHTITSNRKQEMEMSRGQNLPQMNQQILGVIVTLAKAGVQGTSR